MLEYSELLATAVAFHGHLCAGQVLGVRLAMLGCRLLGIESPRQEKRLIVFVEIDRCATDAIQSVTGCTLGKRTLKYLDYGKMAATFLDTASGRAVRIAARDDARQRARLYAPNATDARQAQLQGYAAMPDEELFTCRDVRVSLRPEDAPGPPTSRITCALCGESVNDRRHVLMDGLQYCKPCALGGYYSLVEGEAQDAVHARG